MNNLSPNTYEQYRKAVMSIPRLPVADSRELAWLAWRGDRAARREMVERHLWLVIDAAERLRPWQAQAFESLVGSGNRALVRAAEAYCPWDRREFSEFAWEMLLLALNREAIPTA